MEDPRRAELKLIISFIFARWCTLLASKIPPLTALCTKTLGDILNPAMGEDADWFGVEALIWYASGSSHEPDCTTRMT